MAGLNLEVCYRCGSTATTREHVQPKCIFPEAKDVCGQDYRKDLITVPSCEKHNCGKSHDYDVEIVDYH